MLLAQYTYSQASTFSTPYGFAVHTGAEGREDKHTSLQKVSIAMPLNDAEYTTFAGHIFLRSLTPTYKLSVPLPTLASGTLMPLMASELSTATSVQTPTMCHESTLPNQYFMSAFYFFSCKKRQRRITLTGGKGMPVEQTD